ncbi:hypothetical protein Zmor_023242 [Zophobas morio]|uniref:Uncharacterized protein n=1 Tax=Zophobas morio TaxID=2755281 RepID=A0AA38HXF9_9CUCU|nr:hypothetical protein Zmor_023242 [Zophobas morio]
MSAYEKSCPLKKEGLGKGTPWWNRRFCLLQSGLRKFFNRGKNTKKTEDWEAYKEHRKEFKKEETGNVEILLQRYNVDYFGRKAEESCLEGLPASTRFPKDYF